ncbi:MAG: Trp biosynthesis-associated membrane protein [Pseudolysinimonas sp.]|uniref:Trp biosynthesis-associated membrane protein n=1 Tax=Pseudolysinimonas sp. TaxID=2680009 RepID=UPI0032646260
MTPGRLRLLSLLVLAVLAGLTALASPASPGFSALGLATAAAGAALLLAGPIFRVIIAILLAALGGCIVLVAVYTPVADAVHGWLVLAVVVGGIQVLVGIALAATTRAWPTSGRRYSRTRATGVGDAIGDWDALSAGDDPTGDAPIDLARSPRPE